MSLKTLMPCKKCYHQDAAMIPSDKKSNPGFWIECLNNNCKNRSMMYRSEADALKGWAKENINLDFHPIPLVKHVRGNNPRPPFYISGGQISPHICMDIETLKKLTGIDDSYRYFRFEIIEGKPLFGIKFFSTALPMTNLLPISKSNPKVYRITTRKLFKVISLKNWETQAALNPIWSEENELLIFSIVHLLAIQDTLPAMPLVRNRPKKTTYPKVPPL